MQEMDVILPIFNLVQSDGTLYLKEYRLNSGHAAGIRVACNLYANVFSKAFIDNCGASEEDLEEMIAGFSQLEVIRSLVIRRSVIGPRVVPHIAKIKLQIFPSNLATLKIEKCQISKQTTLELVKCLQGKCYIRNLALVGVNFDQESVRELCVYLAKKPYVEDLDLSDNRMDPKLFRLILEALSALNSLKYINLSWNLFLDKARGPQIGTYVKEENIIYGRADEPIDYS